MTVKSAATAAIVVVLVAVVGVLGYFHLENRTLDELRGSALESATQYTEELATYDFEDPGANLDRVTAASTESFAGTYRDVSGSLTDLLKNGQGKAEGRVTAAGVVELDDEHAVVAVFLDQTVSNLAAPEGRVDSSRMIVGLERNGDRWLLASAEPK